MGRTTLRSEIRKAKSDAERWVIAILGPVRHSRRSHPIFDAFVEFYRGDLRGGRNELITALSLAVRTLDIETFQQAEVACAVLDKVRTRRRNPADARYVKLIEWKSERRRSKTTGRVNMDDVRKRGIHAAEDSTLRGLLNDVDFYGQGVNASATPQFPFMRGRRAGSNGSSAKLSRHQ